jgi:hypothetical protein
MATNDTIQLAVKGVVGGQEHVHTLHFRIWDPTKFEQDLIDHYQANARTEYRALFRTVDTPCQVYTARQVCGSVPLRAPAEEAETAPLSLGTGTGSSEVLPQYTAAVVSVRTALAGKSNRGRFFIGGMLEEHQTAGVMGAGYKAILQAYATKLLTTYTGTTPAGGFSLVVHSRTLAAVPGTDCTDSSHPVTAMIVRDTLGTMRSRKIGHGN